jgi:hypothetical protein
MPPVEPVDLSKPPTQGQVHQFEAGTGDEILMAAKQVLESARPNGKSTRADDILTFEVEEHEGGVFHLIDRDFFQKWVVSIRESPDSTIASAAMAESGYSKHMVFWKDLMNFPTQTYPSTMWTYPRAYRSSIWLGSNPEYRIDYSVFWARLEAVLHHEEWSPCGQQIEPSPGAKVYIYEPLCNSLTAMPESR